MSTVNYSKIHTMLILLYKKNIFCPYLRYPVLRFPYMREIFPAFKMARCQTSFSVMRRNSMLNNTLTPKMIRFGRGMEMKDPVWWLGSNIRLGDGLGSRNRVRKKSPLFVDQGVKLN